MSAYFPMNPALFPHFSGDIVCDLTGGSNARMPLKAV
jgi:hypothetical protein